MMSPSMHAGVKRSAISFAYHCWINIDAHNAPSRTHHSCSTDRIDPGSATNVQGLAPPPKPHQLGPPPFYPKNGGGLCYRTQVSNVRSWKDCGTGAHRSPP